MQEIKITSPSGKLVAYLSESIYHNMYYTVYIADLNIPLAFIINNDIYEIPLPKAEHNKVSDFNKYVGDLLWLRKYINETR